ncbi:unnamed protein product, partial [Mesorhabditis spiculigera]
MGKDKKSKQKKKTKTASSSGENKKSDSSKSEKDSSGSDQENKKEAKKAKFKPRKHQHADQVINHEFFHGILPNDDVSSILTKDGDFLLRSFIPEDDRQAEPKLILSIFWQGKMKNAQIKEAKTKKTVKYVLGGEKHESINDLIDMYQIRKRKLQMGDEEVTLYNPVKRQAWELRHQMVTIEKDKKLGEGAYGRVYKGMLKKKTSEKPIEVAVKELWSETPEAAAEVWREARVMRNFSHPNVVKMYGVCNDKEPYLIVTELVHGGGMDRYLEKRKSLKALPAVKRVQMLLEGAQGMEYIHQQGVIHRDIGARNFLIDKVVKVNDFGLSRSIGKKGYKINTEGDCNLRWIAPDCFTSAKVDFKTDVYAFGITMWEVFKIPYEIPYNGWDGTKVYTEVVENGFRLPPPEHMPEGIRELYAECITTPESRPDFKSIVWILKKVMKDPNARLGTGV